MTTTERFQVSLGAAEQYEARFVPAIFAEWAPLLADISGVGPASRVLDVACGTGIVARTVADRLAGTGRVVGVDLNDGMLAVARRVRPDLDWRQGDAADLPFPDGVVRHRAVPDGADVLPRPGSSPARDGPRRPAGRRDRPGGPRVAGRPAGVRPVRRHGGPRGRSGGGLPAGHVLGVR